MKRTAASALALLAATAAAPLAEPAAAQPAPFDMSGERPAAPAQPQPQPQPQPQGPASPPSVSATTSPVRPDAPANATPPSAPPASASTPNPTPAPSTGWRRHLIAGPELALSGEIDRRRWSIALTREEAEATARLNIAYQNAILVAPEASRLRLLVNDTPLIDAPVASSDGLSDLTVAVPAGLLRPGLNTIGVESTLRHRTDCTVSSTYELWTTLDSGRTFLEFAGSAGDFAPRRLEDVRATGLDGEGLTQIRLALPAGDLSDAAPAVLRLSQGLALLAAMPNQSVEIVQGSVPPARAGTIDVAVAPADAFAALAGALSASPSGGASFLRRADGSSVMALTGSNWDEVAAGAERIVSFVDREGAAPRPAILNPALRTPDAPLMREGGALSFRELGVVSQEFTGRRFRTEFAVAVPGDFFAEAYGEAVVRLDAAYSGEVLPGSLVNLYVNGNIATTLPIGGGGSGALDDFPLRMTMRHLRPGVNTIALEANLLTQADQSCQPGTSTGGAPRFALFDTSRLEVPDFARIARVPDLSAFQGVGFPYNVTRDPVDVVLPDDRAEGLSAAATFLGRIAFSAGHAIPLRLAPAPTGALGSHAIFIGPTRQLPPEALTRAHIDSARAAEWGGQAPGPAAAPALTLEGWQKQFGTASGWRATLSDLGGWLRETFDIEAGGLRLVPASQQPFAPGEDDGLVVAQGEGPAGVWTVLTAPSTAALKDNIALVAREGNWVQLVGRVSAFDAIEGTTASQPVGAASFVPTQPFSVSNMRLILANWLSENVLAYASLIVVVALLLGIATTAFVQTLGHRE